MQKAIEARLAEKLGISEKEADTIFNTTLDALREELLVDPELRLRGFGTFKVIERKARTGRNPRTGEPIEIPAKKAITFKPAKAFVESVQDV